MASHVPSNPARKRTPLRARDRSNHVSDPARGGTTHSYPRTVPTAPLRIVRDGYPDEPGLDTAISRALLLRAEAGDVDETFRLNLPGRVVAFGKRDTISPNYPAAIEAARMRGYAAVERLAGGRAAVFHEGALAFSWTVPDPTPRDGITARFTELADLMVRAFTRLGVDAEVGELPGEYCAGTYSVHASGRIKVMGVGQRLIRKAAHVGGVVVVSDSAALREILVPVYAALELDWDPRTAGALEDVVPGVTLGQTADAILRELAASREVVESAVSPRTVALARELVGEHLAL